MSDLRCGCKYLYGAFIFAAFAAVLCQAGEKSGLGISRRLASSRVGNAQSPYHTSLSSVEESPSKEDIQSKARKPRCQYNNGAIRILLEELILEIFKDLDDMSIELSYNEKNILTRRLRGFYHKATKHPAVHERKIAFSSRKPTFHIELDETLHKGTSQNLQPLTDEIMSKRNGQMQETCESKADWDIVDHGKLRNETIVELYPKSWLFIRNCVSRGNTCNLGNSLSSYVSGTSCLEKYSWVPAYVRQKGYTIYNWDWIKVASCCTCALQAPISL